MISLFLNSRGRVGMLDACLRNTLGKCSNLDMVEVLIRIDSDDHLTVQYADKFKHMHPSLNVRWFIGPRPDNLHVSMNELVEEALGDYLFVQNDDCFVKTQGWDDKVLSFPKDDIWYISTEDNSIDKVRNKQYSSFPILTRPARHALGYFMSEKFVGLGGDVHLWRVFNEVGRIKFSDIEIDHVYHRTVADVNSPDRTALEMRHNTWKDNVDPWVVDISEEARRIHEKITNSV